MKDLPIVTLCLTSYNRKRKLKNCIESFFMTNLYPTEKIEVVIIDNGSDDKETKEYIDNLKIDCYGVKKYFNSQNNYPYCMKIAKNQARDLASGEYFIDCPDDHLFVIKSKWIEKYIDYLSSTQESISCICHYAYPVYRFFKPNNLMSPSKINKNFYVSQRKGYADYHFMSRQTYEEIGRYREDLAFTPSAEKEYMDRSFSLGYKRAMPLLPVSIINEECYKFIKPIDDEVVKEYFNIKQRPMPLTNEELTSYALKFNYITTEEN